MSKINTKFKNKNKQKPINYKWIYSILLWTFVIALIFNFFASILIGNLQVGVAFLVLGIIITIGIFFDGIGIAVATADEIPFHSMAAGKVRGAKEAILMIRNASSVSNFFNDVIGDVCGILSGATAAVIITKLVMQFSVDKSFFDMLLGSVVAAFTVGGKAFGKEIAMRNANLIVYKLGVIISLFKK